MMSDRSLVYQYGIITVATVEADVFDITTTAGVFVQLGRDDCTVRSSSESASLPVAMSDLRVVRNQCICVYVCISVCEHMCFCGSVSVYYLCICVFGIRLIYDHI